LVQESVRLAALCSGEIRTTSYLLHPPLLDEVGLNSALRWYAEGFSKRSGIAVDLQVPESPVRFDEEIELSLFRVVQEALTNVHRHSGSATARIAFEIATNVAILQISDGGVGIDPDKLRLFREGHANLGVGISGMRDEFDSWEANWCWSQVPAEPTCVCKSR
jgi:signal transduction histidine kinase